MSTDRFSRYGHLLKADGTNQLQRTLPALEPGYVRPDERSLSDLVEYARRLAALIRFYDLSGQAVGDWRGFLEPLLADPESGRARSSEDLEKAMASRRDWPPHVALFLVFLKLFRHLQGDLDELPERHLAHYYEKVLGLRRRGASADEVHVLFELARNAAPTLLAEDTPLDAGKDGEGRALTYTTRADLAVSAARVAEIRRLVAETDRRGRRRFFVSDAVSEEEGASWATFGLRQLALPTGQRFMTEAEIGFALASPVLRMGEGERVLRVEADLRAEAGSPPPAQEIGFGLVVEITGAEGWIRADGTRVRLLDGAGGARVLAIELSLDGAAPAVVPFDPALHGPGPVSEWPVLRVLLGGEGRHYETLDGLVVERVRLRAGVRGVRDLLVQNDQGVLSPDQPIPLFGTRPHIGSRFYVGSAEVFAKRLTSLSINVEWQDTPEDFVEHYRAYFDSLDGLDNLDGRFLVDVHMLYDRSWDHRILFNESLFGPGESRARSIATVRGAIENAFKGRDYSPRPGLTEVSPLDADTRQGFVRLTLAGPSIGAPQAAEVRFEAFGHKAFDRRYASQAIALSRFDPASGDPEPELPTEPYTPTLADLSLDYEAEATLSPGDPATAGALFVLDPWGYRTAGGETEARLVPDLDRGAGPAGAAAPFQGALFLGLEGLEPPANLSLLFQIDDGTATAGEILRPGEVEWSFLRGSVWERLGPQSVLNDTTYGFQQPGLVVLSVGRQATVEHTTMPAGRVWLRALVRRPPESSSRTEAVHAQAVLARFEPRAGRAEGDERHLRDGLAAGTITRLRSRNVAIKGVKQPYRSFGGRGGEEDAQFFRRTSERLRHRDRAVTGWDFERLVLEAFPEVFKVKCLPHSDVHGNRRAGEAALVIVPDLRSPDPAHFLEPRAGAVLMSRIQDFVESGLTTPFAEVHVIHPVFERLVVDARVGFRPGLDAGFHANRLDLELQRFLSPWAFQEGRDIVFGARIYRSEVLAFVEGRDYVDFVTDFNLYHSYEGPRRGGIGEMTIGLDFVIQPPPRPGISGMTVGDDFVVGWGVEVAETSRPHAILVSHPEHRIRPVDPDEDVCSGVAVLGIGYMTVGLDFDVHPESANP